MPLGERDAKVPCEHLPPVAGLEGDTNFLQNEESYLQGVINPSEDAFMIY